MQMEWHPAHTPHGGVRPPVKQPPPAGPPPRAIGEQPTVLPMGAPYTPQVVAPPAPALPLEEDIEEVQRPEDRFLAYPTDEPSYPSVDRPYAGPYFVFHEGDTPPTPPAHLEAVYGVQYHQIL